MNTQQLRQHIKIKRRTLSEAAREGHASRMRANLTESGLLDQHQKLGFYWSSAGEMPTQRLLELANQAGKDCYLPVIDSGGHNFLHFAPFHSSAELRNNKFSIPEPLHSHQQLIEGEQLDLVFVPLVAVDKAGNRVGMGKGYYDRTFQFMRAPRPQITPLLVGLAYEFQRVERLEPQSWDVPLAMLITEKSCYDFRQR